MNLEGYNRTSQELLAFASDIEKSKRPGYTMDNEDVLHNFKRDASILGVTPYIVISVHLMKQFFAILRFLKNPKAYQAESFESRLADMINYCKLAYALFHDEEGFKVK